MCSKTSFESPNAYECQTSNPQVLMIAPYYLPSHGGIENHVYGLSHFLSNKGWKIEIAAATMQDLHDFSENGVKVKYEKVNFHPFNNPVSLKFFRNVFSTKAKIIHAHGLYQFTSFVAKIAASVVGKPVVLTMHGIANYSGPLRLLQSIYELLFIKGAFHVNHYIALTKADEDFLVQYGVGKDRISIIPNAIDLGFWKPPPDLVRHSKDIVFVGSLVRRKRPDLLVCAFGEYLKQCPGAQLYMVGEGPEMEKLLRLTHSKGLDRSIRFLGRIKRADLLKLYQTCDLFVLPSEAEGLPTALLEAMACGAIALATNLPGIRHVIEHGTNGFLFDIASRSSLIETLLRAASLTNEERERVRLSAIRTVQLKFSWEYVASNVMVLYKQVLQAY